MGSKTTSSRFPTSTTTEPFVPSGGGTRSVWISVVFRDDRILVVDKPSGIAVHRGWDRAEDVLLQQVRSLTGVLVHPVHRLDKATSGLVLFALDKEAARFLSGQFAAGEVKKEYVGITRGHPPDECRVDHPVPKRPKGPRVDAITDVQCVETFGRYALVRAIPRTGRFHQIRRHLKHLSCPLIGDVNYGKGEHNRIFREEHGLHRLALHAERIRFIHPDGDARSLETPIPPDIAGAIRSCRQRYKLEDPS